MTATLTADFDSYLLALRATPVDQQTEMTSRGALETLLKQAVAAFGGSGVTVTHEPLRAQGKGAPDFKIAANGMTLGYLENKAIGENLAKVAKSDQIKKYLDLSTNILLTDYLDWWWITPDGTQQARLATPSDLEGKPTRVRPERAAEVEQLLRGFFSQPPRKIGTAKALAEALATRSQLLRDFLGEELVRQQEAKAGGVLMGLYTAFKQQVSHEITLKEFADAFAQTLAYGLFLAKLNTKPTDIITLLNAKQFVPASVGLIQELVGFIDRLDEPRYADIRWVVEEILSIINNLALDAIHEDLAFRNRKARRGTDSRSEEEWRLFSRDPFIYFYEDYLAKYDAKMRKSRGVYYTPPPIVNFIVRAIDDILKDSFGIAEGLADRKRVTVLDFATGTGTFLVEVLERIFEQIGGPGSAKAPLVVRDHILKNIYGFEYLIAPYTIAHLKLAQYLRDKEVQSGRASGELTPRGDERFQVYLTNTLEPIDPEPNYLLPELSQETAAAQAVKEKPILVITGNPPYSGASRNNGPATRSRVEKYKSAQVLSDNGTWRSEPMSERNLRAVQEDYIKFFSFAEEKMMTVDQGIVGIITNHGFLDSPTLRGFRQSLMRSFDQIFVIDLHGSTKRREVAPDGSKDENVFDIEPGVAITFLVKAPHLEKGVWKTDWWGKRAVKYHDAASTSFKDVKWKKIDPKLPQSLFKDRDNDGAVAYDDWWSVSNIFGASSVGLVTARDHLTIQNTTKEIEDVAQRFCSLSVDDAREYFRLGPDSRDWSVERAQADLKKAQPLAERVGPLLYRPFDTRASIFTGRSRGFLSYPRDEMMRHMRQPNIGLITSRLTKGETFRHVLATETAIEKIILSPLTSNNGFLFPLYLYKALADEKSRQYDWVLEDAPFSDRDRIENIDPKFRAWIDARYDRAPSPEQVFGYIYAILHAPAYRTAYADFLRTDFPRIPFAKAWADFEALAALGWELAEIQLLRRAPVGVPPGRFVGKGANAVGKPRWSEREGIVWINDTQGLAGITPDVWAFTIGGYQVLDKYLKSRKGRTLSLDEIEHLERVIAVLGFTIRQMDTIDAAYDSAFAGLPPESDAAVDDIHSDPGIMGGEPVFRGTRLPVRSVAEMLEQGADEGEMLEGYPGLTLERMALARLWAHENPPSPEPARSPNYDFKVLSRRSVPRRREGDEGGAPGKARA